MPDFDIDFSDERRQEMIDYVVRKYGSDHVAQIVTFGTMAAKAAIRDVGRAMAIPYAAVDAVAKLVPNKLNITLDEALKLSKDLRERYEKEPEIHRAHRHGKAGGGNAEKCFYPCSRCGYHRPTGGQLRAAGKEQRCSGDPVSP